MGGPGPRIWALSRLLSIIRVLIWWRRSLLPWPPGLRGFGSGLFYALYGERLRGPDTMVAYGAAVGLCQSRSFHGL